MRLACLLTVLSLCACGASAPPPEAKMPEPPREPPPPVKVEKVVAKKEDPPPVVREQPPPPRRVRIDVAATNKFVPAAKAQEIIVRLRVTAERVEVTKRRPINLTVVVDTSGSMLGDGIDRSRAACITLLERIVPGDSLAVVGFGSRAEVLVPATVIAEDNIASIRTKIEAMAASGTTDMAGGLATGLAQAQQRLDPRAINRIVLLGDGVPNDPNPILPVARNAGQLGVSITALGLGLEYDETMMGQIAQASGGTFHFIDKPERVAAVFDEEVRRMKQVVQKAGWLTLTPGPGVALRGVIGSTPSPSGRGFLVPLGDMIEGQTREVLVRAAVGKHVDGAVVEVFDAVLTYQDALNDMIKREERAFASATSTASEEKIAGGRDREVEHLAAKMMVADMTVRAIGYARSGDIKTARSLVDEATKIARDGAKNFADEELAKKVKELTKLRASLPSLMPAPQVSWHGGGAGVGRSMGAAPAAAAPAEARAVRKAHSDAFEVLQGF